MDVSTRSLITDPDLLSFTLAVVAPVGVLCGIASAIIGMPSWMFLTPLLFVNLNLPVLDAIFAAMLADLCNAVLLSLLYRKVAQLNYRYVAALGLACAVVGPPVALLTHKLLLEHEDWFKGGVAYATFATGLFFVVKGIFECRKERCSGKKAVFMEVDESDIDAHDAVAATRVQLTNPTSDDDDHDRDDDERDSRDVPVRFRARSSIVDDGYAPAFDSDRDSDSDDADNAALLGGKPTSIRRRASGLSPLQRQRSPCTQRVFTAMPVLAALGCAVFAGFLGARCVYYICSLLFFAAGMFGTVTVAGVLIGFRSYPLLRATAASLVIVNNVFVWFFVLF